MAKYTVMLKDIVESGYPLGLDNYPIFDEEYRGYLNAKIINHYYMREIGFETAGLFVNRLNVKMNEIMPLYNQKYESLAYKIDPFQTYKFNQTKKYSDNRNDTNNLDTTTKTVASDTPQGLLSIGDIENELYASNATIGNGGSESTSKGTSDGTETIEASGSLAGTSFSKLMKEYRSTFLNVDMEVIDELEELFLQIWDY